MDAQEIRWEIERLKMSGETLYENCEALVTLEKALRKPDKLARYYEYVVRGRLRFPAFLPP